jgi:pyruvate,water dikinase
MLPLAKIKDWLQRKRQPPQPKVSLEPPAALVERYGHYKRLLAANSAILAIQTDLQLKMHEGFLFDMAYVRTTCSQLEKEVKTLVDSLIAMSRGHYQALEKARLQIASRIHQVLAGPELKPGPLVLPLQEVQEGQFFGGKAEKLGELLRLSLPTPPGFAISAYAQRLFFEESGLEELIHRLIDHSDISNLKNLKKASEAIREHIITQALPQELGRLLNGHLEQLGAGRVSVRSSALQEDSLFSFAGQFETFLNVPAAEVGLRYKEVVASQFTPRALYYCHTKGFSYEELAMGVVVMQMVESQAAGVLYTADPRHGDKASIINAVCGLGSLAVGGQVNPDVYRVEEGQLVSQQVGDKAQMQVPAPAGGILETVTPVQLQGACLDEVKALRLAALGSRLETHFGYPQDVEWAMDPQGQFYLLQARPLRLSGSAGAEYMPPRLKEAEIILENSVIVSRGAAAGPVFRLTQEGLAAVPRGAVVVTRRALPEYGVVVDRAAALVCETGSVTSHLATVLREAGLPALFGVKDATSLLAPETMVTVDAYYGNIYAGRQEELLKAPKSDTLVRQSRAYQVLDGALKHITPLHLLDPRAKDFHPQNCTTYHDITRFAHEKAMTELFQVSEQLPHEEGVRFLKTNIPLEIYVVDLGGGLSPEVAERFVVQPEQVQSRPLQAYWRGVAAVGWKGPKPVDVKGFMSIVMGTGAGEKIQERLTEKNFAIIAAEYMNLSTRLGFHFATIESHLGTAEDSYASLIFYGGGAEVSRRVRRVRFMAKVLQHVDFRVELKDDSLTARIDGVEVPIIEEKLDILGRLMMVTKQMDMIMFSDNMVDFYYKEFIREGYNLRL